MADLTITAPPPVDLANCDREPIHIPGSVQSHATILVLEEPSLVIRQASINCAETLGVPHAQLIGESLGNFITALEFEHLRGEVLARTLEAAPYYLPPIRVGPAGKEFEAQVHRFQGALILELEHWPAAKSLVYHEVFSDLKSTLDRLQGAFTVVEFCQRAADQIRAFIGFDRVMVYRFAPDLSGHIIAEARRQDLDSYLGWHYPASDIPKQARELFKRSKLRLIPDLRYAPVPIAPTLRPGKGLPLDMSYCVTRSVSPIHVEYLQNMGVDASMSISVVIDGELWGLVACHHYSARYVPHTLRMACDFLAQTLSFLVAGKEASDDHFYAMQLNESHRQFETALLEENDFGHAIARLGGTTIGGIKADGAVLVSAAGVESVGLVPGAANLRAIAAWLAENVTETVFDTDRLDEDSASLAALAPQASGLLAVCLSREQPAYFLWFRREVLQTVNWAGDPNKPVAAGPLGDRLTPRKSFALWQEEVRDRSEVWVQPELAAAVALRNTYLELFARQAQELARLNAELAERNSQLDAFTYIASHDLKEPLRGIHNFTQFVLEDCAKSLDAEGLSNLQTVVRLSRRMEMLLDALLKYSRLSRSDLSFDTVDLNEVVAVSVDLLSGLLQSRPTEIRIPRPLPLVHGEVNLLVEVFANLMSNAIKYNDKPGRWIELGYQDGTTGPVVLYVADNGIGIAPEHHENVFRIFRRLHAREEFGGGTGAGLTIVRKIVERHDGKIWLESETKAGSRFLFSLLPALNP